MSPAQELTAPTRKGALHRHDLASMDLFQVGLSGTKSYALQVQVATHLRDAAIFVPLVLCCMHVDLCHIGQAVQSCACQMLL